MGQFSKVYNLIKFEVHKQSLANKLFRIGRFMNGDTQWQYMYIYSLVGHTFPMG
jgi:hypothetical protein